jgi:hypothetical protein
MCPVCRYNLEQNQTLFQDQNLVMNLIESFDINCDFKSKGCQQIFTFGSRKIHLEMCNFFICSMCEMKMGPTSEHNCAINLKKLYKNSRQWLTRRSNQILLERHK